MVSESRILGAVVLMGLVWMQPSHATAQTIAPSWKPVAPACLPHRAQLWQEGYGEAQQASCHCPNPAVSQCPRDGRGYMQAVNAYISGNYGATPMPTNMFNRCCLPPRCPAGTTLAGHIMPADNQCNVYCPGDSDAPGRILALGEDPSVSCYNYCPSSTYFAGHRVSQVPGSDCGYTCPGGTDRAGQLPERDANGWVCNNPKPEDPPVQPQPDPPVYQEPAPEPAPPPPSGCAVGMQYQCWSSGGDGGGSETCGCIWVGSGNSCFSGDSLVEKEDGTKVAIRTILIGDKVKGPSGVLTVKATNHYQQTKVAFYQINDLPFLVTGDHPIQTTKGPKIAHAKTGDALQLKVGDALVAANGKTVTVERIEEVVPKEDALSTYNIAVEGDKPVFVGGVAVLPFRELLMKY